MERRVLLAIFLCFLVLYVYQALLPKPTPRSNSVQPGKQAQGTQAVKSGAPDLAPAEAPTPPPAEGPASALTLGETAERDIGLDTDQVSAVFSNRGAILKSWKLKHFQDSRGQPYDLIPQELRGDTPRPFSLRLDDSGLSSRLNSALYKVDAASSGALRFEYADASGLKSRKIFSLTPRSYLLSADISVTIGGREIEPILQWGPGIGPLVEDSSQRAQIEGIVYVDGDVERLSASAATKQPTYSGTIVFAGVDDRYFLAALVRPTLSRIQYRVVSVPIQGSSADRVELIAYDAQLRPKALPQRIFIGPKDVDVLKATDPELVRAINFGWFAWLVVPLLTSLKWLNSYIGNYGWSIIVLTVLINALMFPLRHKSVVSMRKMQEIQPEVKAIQDRYAKLKATDPAKQKMNTELMALYRERGVNPASGCIPMILTMPVLFAFYSLLSQAIELRGAPFIGWITDLSAHDRFYVTPILMGVTMMLQQRMTPTTMDPVQQKMMMIMPVVFTAMSFTFPSGLVLYWLVSNVWAIGQQMLTNRLIGPPPVRAVRPPAERRLKRAGAGKTEAAEKSE